MDFTRKNALGIKAIQADIDDDTRQLEHAQNPHGHSSLYIKGEKTSCDHVDRSESIVATINTPKAVLEPLLSGESIEVVEPATGRSDEVKMRLQSNDSEVNLSVGDVITVIDSNCDWVQARTTLRRIVNILRSDLVLV